MAGISKERDVRPAGKGRASNPRVQLEKKGYLVLRFGMIGVLCFRPTGWLPADTVKRTHYRHRHRPVLWQGTGRIIGRGLLGGDLQPTIRWCFDSKFPEKRPGYQYFSSGDVRGPVFRCEARANLGKTIRLMLPPKIMAELARS